MDLISLEHATHYKHSQMVSQISGILARNAGYTGLDEKVIRQSALLHDIGKVCIPPSILNKPAALTAQEYSIVKTHTALGQQQISEAIQILVIAAIVAQHHEHFDGGGYMGLKGDQIHPFARIVSASDVCDALLSKRAYKDAWSQERVRDYFKEQAGKQFGQEVVELLLRSYDEILALYS